MWGCEVLNSEPNRLLYVLCPAIFPNHLYSIQPMYDKIPLPGVQTTKSSLTCFFCSCLSWLLERWWSCCEPWWPCLLLDECVLCLWAGWAPCSECRVISVNRFRSNSSFDLAVYASTDIFCFLCWWWWPSSANIGCFLLYLIRNVGSRSVDNNTQNITRRILSA